MKGFSCFALALGLRAASALQADPENPVTRVVGLLEGLQSRIQKDGEYEQGKYDKFACWCEETTGKTAATITSVRDLLKTTGQTILRLKGSVATLSSEISGLVADIKKNQEQQAEQTNIREKQNAAYLAEKSELESAIAALQKAVQVLGAATTGASFVQTTQMATAMSEVVATMSQASMSVKLDAKQLVLLSQLSGKDANSYAPQSATIQGILGDMYTTFAKNLQTSTADEAKAHRSYEDIMATYQKQLNTLQETLVKKQQHKSEDEIQLADATQTYADSEEQLKAEVTLFDSTKKSCTEKTSDWSKRSKARTSELDGIKEALKILTSDESKAIFDKSIKPGFSKGGAAFIQVASHSVTATGAEKAVEALESHARQTSSFRLASLAASVRGGHFDEVLGAIDKLLVQLTDEETADNAKVKDCKKQYHDITSSKEDLGWKITNNEAKVQKHQKAIDEKTAAKVQTITDIATADTTLDDMLSQRTTENDAYKAAKSDDEKAIGLLQKAKAALQVYYKKNSLLQQEKPEPEMKLSKKNSAHNQAKGVLKLLDMIVEDLSGELAEEKAAEAAAQKDYESMKKAVEEQRAKLDKARINLKSQIDQEGTAKTDEEDLKVDNEDELGTQETTEVTLKKTCDDAIRLQPERRKKRKIEADGLTQAREFLAGMSSDAFIQSHKASSTKIKLPTFQALSFLQI